MINILLFVHIVIAILLIIVILMQKTGSDGLSGIGGGNWTMGVVAGRTVVNFLTRTTVVLATLFMINAVILANLSSKKNSGIIKKIEQVDDKQQESSLPIAK
jgi:preprotein translocase subunit SecG